MILVRWIVITLVSLSFAPSSFAQQINSNVPDDSQLKPKVAFDSSTEIAEGIERAVQKIQHVCDIVKRESLKLTSRRELQYRCGRYWVDTHSKLISPSDREVGLWGIETMDEKNMPSSSIRK